VRGIGVAVIISWCGRERPSPRSASRDARLNNHADVFGQTRIHQRFSESREDNALDAVMREFLQFTNDFLEKCFVHMLLTVPKRTELPAYLISCGVYAVETLEIAVFRLLNIDGERGGQRDSLRKLLSLGIVVWLDLCHCSPLS